MQKHLKAYGNITEIKLSKAQLTKTQKGVF